jgi:hypothetical protein
MTATNWERYRENTDEAISRRAAAWNQSLRIESYLPVLAKQRDEAAAKLAEIEQLIADEKQAIIELRAEAQPERKAAKKAA